MKRIAIFCDGTWNSADAAAPTNVVKLARAVLPRDANDVFQHVIYLEGVGTGRGSSRIARTIDRVFGGAFGWGLMENVEDLYRQLCFSYELGDEIYIFGFSRGAYTARSLAGLIRSSGLPRREGMGQVGEAVARYRSRQSRTHPNDLDSMAFRLRYSPDLHTSASEADWRLINDHPEGLRLKISYLGVWDTVGALGVPAQFNLLSGVLNVSHRFHDTALSSSVARARHAVAIDERRRTFEPTLWDNLDQLAEAAQEPDAYLQQWFPGTHGSVGGGGEIVGLSNITLRWIAEGAARNGDGLAFDPVQMQALRDAEAADATPLRNTTRAASLSSRLTALSERDRDGPRDPRDVSQAARLRLRAVPRYRPPTLAAVAEALLAQ